MGSDPICWQKGPELIFTLVDRERFATVFFSSVYA